ncbi:MAG: trypsin-like peptidase domain-containing protein [Planctomycetales bacterium]|nr:trypsin-like peptidase domain-containing protein [Planctomycetales bacterium]
MIETTCDTCGAKYKLPDFMGGKTKKCRKCGQAIQIPLRQSIVLKAPRRPRPLLWMSIGAAIASVVIFSVQTTLKARQTRRHHPVVEISDNSDNLTEAQQVYNQTIESIVYIHGFKEGRRTGHGSGFILYPGDKIATNEHVIRGNDYVIVETYWRHQLRIKYHVGADRYRDVALLPVPADIQLSGLRLSNQTYSKGDRMFTIGSPLDVRFGISEGVLVEFAKHVDLTSLGQLVQVDISVAPGASGSPLLDREGEVVGVISRATPKNRKNTFAVPAEAVQDLIAKECPLTLFPAN